MKAVTHDYQALNEALDALDKLSRRWNPRLYDQMRWFHRGRRFDQVAGMYLRAEPPRRFTTTLVGVPAPAGVLPGRAPSGPREDQ